MSGVTGPSEAVIFTGDGTVTTGAVELPPLGDDDVLMETRVSVGERRRAAEA